MDMEQESSISHLPFTITGHTALGPVNIESDRIYFRGFVLEQENSKQSFYNVLGTLLLKFK